MLVLTVYPIVYRLFTPYIFPAFAAAGLSCAAAGYVALRETRLATDRFLVVVILCSVNLLASILFLSPALLTVGCADPTSPRPCGLGPSVCGVDLITSIAASVFVWRGVQESRRSRPQR